jgi:hypothetical protein
VYSRGTLGSFVTCVRLIKLCSRHTTSLPHGLGMRGDRRCPSEDPGRRAEPVSALYEQARVHHVGALSTPEDQMCSFTPDLDRDRAKSSPDRVEALVWAFTELIVEGTAAAWIEHYGAMAAAANATSLPLWRATPCRGVRSPRLRGRSKTPS